MPEELIIIDEELKDWLYPVVFGSIGCETRIKIIKTLNQKTMAINQIAKELGMSYKGIHYQIKQLVKHKILQSVGDNYGVLFYLTSKMEMNYSVFEHLVSITTCPRQTNRY